MADILASAASFHISIPSLVLSFLLSLQRAKSALALGQVGNASGLPPHSSSSPVHPSLSLLVTMVIFPASDSALSLLGSVLSSLPASTPSYKLSRAKWSSWNSPWWTSPW